MDIHRFHCIECIQLHNEVIIVQVSPVDIQDDELETLNQRPFNWVIAFRLFRMNSSKNLARLGSISADAGLKI